MEAIVTKRENTHTARYAASVAPIAAADPQVPQGVTLETTLMPDSGDLAHSPQPHRTHTRNYLPHQTH